MDIQKNIKLHDKIAKKYEQTHGEIYNDIEQSRLVQDLKSSFAHLNKDKITALDLGCGAGNLTNHLLDMGCKVIASDVSKGFLNLVEDKFKGRDISTFELNGENLKGIDDNSIDFIATYSVLHHIPDYILTVKEMCRVCSPGGVIYIDHEQNEEYWENNLDYQNFRSSVSKIDFKKFFVFANYVGKIRRVFDPRYTNEGDIHVWPDDHIEWSLIDNIMTENGFIKILQNDFLLYNRNYKDKIYNKYKSICTDMRAAAYQKEV